MKYIVLLPTLIVLLLSVCNAEDKYFDQLPTVTDTIRFNNFEYSVDTKFLDKKLKRLYPYELFLKAFRPNWRFECVYKFDSLLTFAYFFSENQENCDIQIHFFDKRKYNIDSIIDIQNLNDSITFEGISGKEFFKDLNIKNNLPIKIQSIDYPLPLNKIPEKIKKRIQKEIDKEAKEEKEKHDAGKKYYGEYCKNVEDYYVSKRTDNHYDYYVENPHPNLKKYQAYMIKEDPNFLIFFVLRVKELKQLKNNFKNFQMICDSFRFIQDNYSFDYSRYDSLKSKLKHYEHLFYKAYKEYDIDAFKKYLDIRSLLELPISKSELDLKPEWEQEIYKIYRDFYHPRNPRFLPFIEKSLSRSKRIDTSYYLIQGEIDVTIVDNIDLGRPSKDKLYDTVYKKMNVGNTITYFTLKNFRPYINISGAHFVYLTSFFRYFLEDFLKSDMTPLGTGGLMNPVSAAGLSLIRENFLNSVLHVMPKHWSQGWHIASPPIMRITINSSLNIAIIHYRKGYFFGSFVVKKVDNKWKFLFGEAGGVE